MTPMALATKPMSFLRLFACVAIVVTPFTFICIQLDLVANDWIGKTALSWSWTQYFASTHGIAGLYVTSGWWWLIVPLLFSAVIALVIRAL